MIDISVSNVSKEFEVGNRILDGLTFQVDTGERVGLLGKNGAGKTTLFRILTGELEPDEGQVSTASGKRVGLISQIPVYPVGYTVDRVLRTAFDRLKELEALLQVSRKRAFAHRDNSFNRDMDYYARYMEMRWEQYRILERLFLARDRLTEVSRPAYLVANFMRTMALSLHEYNNAQDLLQELTLIRRHFQSGELPVTRREFENRAVLYEIVFELRQLLLLKQGFAASLTPSQIRLFWKEAPIRPGWD